MNIVKERNNDTLNVTLEGRLDTNTAPELEKSLDNSIEGIKTININFENLTYVSSAGLRVLLIFHKKMTECKGTLYILKPTDEVMEVFDITGFSTFLNIKE
ncbi:MAG: STAS domain-containing protein [Acholeplasmatales bacterium]|nr:STAS domain-containing protein [Acholeplasmatales bacterium]